jgi:hypothetical protein
MSLPNPPAHPVRLILDTDMGNDIDDALALAMIHSLQSLGECELLGVVTSKDNPMSAPFIDMINWFYGRPEIPVGAVRNGVTPEEKTFLRPILEAKNDDGSPRFPRCLNSNEEAPEAVGLLRRLLAAQEDQSVVIVMIGFSTNMARLLASGPDAVSPLAGRELLLQKVRFISAMAGRFSDYNAEGERVSRREYNVIMDLPAAREFFDNCPLRVVFSGEEIGRAVLYPFDSIDRDFTWSDRNPITEGYRLFRPMPHDRPSWDQTSVLQAVRPDACYFSLSEPGRVVFDHEGGTTLAPETKGLHRHLILGAGQAERVIDVIVELCIRPPDKPVESPSKPA